MTESEISNVFWFEYNKTSSSFTGFGCRPDEWNSDRPLDIFGRLDASNGSPWDTCYDGENTPFNNNKDGASEYVRHLSSEITGGYGALDIFSNETVLYNAVIDLSGDVHTNIKAKLTEAGTEN